ncbi:uncharacterized protein KY384_008237 [Bacidia gigantensis]|uniref:uncharacterized protein n=1 Tax=Bacidia gigantensis TaxID=2732470 RepID=UPI001D058213|nr:uncharacterized protein KY384_008237 [Bacidia gigantensis]KAG8526808.1 hypothetical protein KY384_008237 [Bacidia gigantensis]
MEKRMSSFAPLKSSKKAESADNTASRQNVESSFHQFAQLIHAAQRPLPNQSGDGAYLDHAEPTGLMGDLKRLGFKDAKTLMDVMKSKATGELQDDKTYIMERTIQLVASLPTLSKTRKDLTNAFIDELWNSLQHPPLSYLGDKFQYRSGDGSYNNVMYPHLGAANTPYARSVMPNTIFPGALPDPGLIFDSVMARNTFKPHPNRVSSVFFYWASLIIHDLFQTDHHDFNNSKTSSYLDLSTLYEIAGFPPGCGVMLIMLNRFHNYVVEQLALINEGGRFTKPNEGLSAEKREKSWAKYDNDLFQTGRLIVCGLYINITLLDYLRTIVNLNRTDTTWTLDPRAEMGRIFGKDGTQAGVGNQVSAEFNLAYRWHSCISQRDEQWTEELYRKLFGKKAEDVTLQELMMGLGKWEQSLDKDPFKRDFAGLKRGPDGKLPDDELVEIFVSSVEDVSGTFGPNNIPKCLKAITILGMQQSRAWNLGSLNEFRKFFGLKPHETFEDICSEVEVSDQLRNLYEHPDWVEMYPGMVSESAKVPMVPGAGITPNFTISRAILSDAVTLVRGDRFYTIDYNARNLTNWGYSEVQYDLAVQEGCVFYKLCIRAFPNHFKQNSIYAHYPMTVPDENRKIMKSLGREENYNYDRPRRMPERVNFTSYKAAKHILEHAQQFNVVWTEPFIFLMGKQGGDFMLSGDTAFHAKQRKLMGECLYRDQWQQQIKDFYEYITLKLLKEKSCKIAGINQVDITRDVGNLAHVHFAANVFSLPLKTEDHPHGVYSEQELYMVLGVLFTCLFFDLDPAKSFPLRMGTRSVVQQLGKLIEANVKMVNATGFISGIVDSLHQDHTPLKDYGVHMVRKLLESGLGVSEITWSQILPTAGAMVANQAQVFTQLIDYYLSDKGKQHLPDINKTAKTPGPEADKKLLHYAMEGIRLNGTFGAYRLATEDTTLDDNGRQVKVKKGDKVFCSFVSANREAEFFPDPDTVKLDRPIENYIHYGLGPHACLGGEASRTGLTAMLRVVGKLDNLRRAPGPVGELKKIPRPGGFYVYMRSDHGSYWPFPTTMKDVEKDTRSRTETVMIQRDHGMDRLVQQRMEQQSM